MFSMIIVQSISMTEYTYTYYIYIDIHINRYEKNYTFLFVSEFLKKKLKNFQDFFLLISII